MTEDTELLRRYAADHSEAAFAELVQRRLDLVYSVALRQVGGDAHLAQDVTQRVFADLARKAAKLAERAVLSGWLYRSAQFAASDVVRSERRRRAREQEAEIMREDTADSANDAGWEKIRPVLDEVMGELPDSDRDAIALRFLDDQSFTDIGHALRLSEDGARKRVERALDKLHALLARRGVTSTTAALALTLTGQAATSAPAGLAVAITGTALAGTAAGTAASAGWWLAFMSMSKIQVGIVAALALAGVAGYVSQARVTGDLRRELATGQNQPREIAALRTENRGLADALTEVEALRRDDAELKQLAEEAVGLKKRSEDAQRVNQARTDNRQRIQSELERINREGIALVQEYKALQAQARDPSLPEQAKAEVALALQQKAREIGDRQYERDVLIQSTQTSGVVRPVVRIQVGPKDLKDGTIRAAPSLSFRSTDANSLPAANSPSSEVSP
jgi:RNA polymerase sigma factor (sigma-70 family)